MSFTVSKPIAEADVAATLRTVLQEVVMQNKVCTALVKSRIEGLGTAKAKVVLTFDDAACKEANTAS
jgi:2-methylaconitate cis-trans-isomerase PrpF